MAKIRGFKPDLWTDEDFVEVSAFARLLWLGMWNFACDNGHLADKSKQIKMRVLPTDDVNCAELLRELEAQGLILRSDGWITVPNLTRHQRPDKRWWQTCEKPDCAKPKADSQPETRGGHAGPRGGQTGPPDDVSGVDGDVSGGEAKRAPRRSASSPLSDDWQPNDTHRSYASSHRIDLERELFKFRNHALANDRRQVNWNATFTTWLAKASEFAPARPAARAATDRRPEAW